MLPSKSDSGQTAYDGLVKSCDIPAENVATKLDSVILSPRKAKRQPWHKTLTSVQHLPLEDQILY